MDNIKPITTQQILLSYEFFPELCNQDINISKRYCLRLINSYHSNDKFVSIKIFVSTDKDITVSLSLSKLNALSQTDATAEFLTCCTSSQWAQTLADARPFADTEALLNASDTAWQQAQTDEANLIEAFDGHPQIGNVDSLKEKYRNTQGSAAHEQSGANDAEDAVLEALAQGNQD